MLEPSARDKKQKALTSNYFMKSTPTKLYPALRMNMMSQLFYVGQD